MYSYTNTSSVLQYFLIMPPQDLELINLPTCLENVKVKSMPNSAYYIADFISQAEEEIILNKVRVSNPTSEHTVQSHD
jgi:hypothetical protein